MRSFLLALVVWSVAPAALSAPDLVDLGTLSEPICDAPLVFTKASGTCGLKQGVAAASVPLGECKVPGLEVQGGTCTLKAAEVRSPYCRLALTGLVYDPQQKVCKASVSPNSSSRGDYIGDCFQIVAVPPDSGLRREGIYGVTEQESLPSNDKKLTLVEARLGRVPWFGQWGCIATNGPATKVNASELDRHAAKREGWAYGALTMPYKYYPGTKSFVSGLPLGAYLGWRAGQLGSGGTFAAALTLSQVKADTVDPKTLDAQGKPTKTGTADVQAISAAVGFLFDVTKTNGGRPFKAGLFVGKDRVNASPTISFPQDRKWWVAVQLGYDFTDN
jgi:hypothetical protein